MNEIMKLNPVSFNWKGKESDKQKLGLIAQEVGVLFQNPIGIVNNEHTSINYIELIAPIISCLQKIDERLERLENRK